MNGYNVATVFKRDILHQNKIDVLLEQEGIRRDDHLDYRCAIFDEHDNAIATGSCFGNTLRCMAVSSSHQGFGLLNKIVTHLIEVQHQRNNDHIFLYTKPESANFFLDIGFHIITTVSRQLVFMENKLDGFRNYLKKLQKETIWPQSAAIIMNANPFILGHLHLIETAAKENDRLHLFIVSEDVSLFPYEIRRKLIIDSTEHLMNISYHTCGDYMISNATFPGYFMHSKKDILTAQAIVDVNIFKDIARTLNITRRYVGEEPNSTVTKIYNDVMSTMLPAAGIECIIIDRKMHDGIVISASRVRQAIHDGKFGLLSDWLPSTTLSFLKSPSATSIIEKIQRSSNVVHY